MEERYRLKQWPLEAGGEKELDAQSGQLVVLVNSGSGRLQWSGRSAALGPDSIALLRPGAVARASAGEQGLELWQLRLQPGLLEEISCPGCDLEACFSVVPFQCAVVRLNTPNATLLRRLYSMLQKETEQPDALAGGVYRRGLVELLVAGVLRCCVNEERKTALVGRKRLVVDEVFAYINAHLAEPLQLKDLAAHFYVSPEHLARQFKQRTGQTLHQYIIKARLSRCRELLCNGVPLSAIWMQCGFSGYSAMLRSFKQEFGVTPAEYYRQCCQRAREYPEEALPETKKSDA